MQTRSKSYAKIEHSGDVRKKKNYKNKKPETTLTMTLDE